MAGIAARAKGDKRRWRNTLQARLIASHAIVILIALGLVLLISSAFLRRYERTAAERQLAQLAVPLLAEVNVARFAGLTSELRQSRRVDAIDAQAEAMEVRILVLNQAGEVLYDTATDEPRHGETIAGYSAVAARLIAEAQKDSALHYVYDEPRGRDLFAGERLLIAAGRTGPFVARNAILVVTDRPGIPLLGLFLPRLLIVAGISLLVASAFAYWLSRRFAEPVRTLTAAADAMATGDLEQQVTVDGPEEIEGLVRSFNSMSKQVATSHRSQRELLANVAHELRTPLTSVQGYARAIRDGVIEGEAERSAALAVIGRESERMSTLIAQLLDLSRLESGQAKLAFLPVPVPALFERLRERFQPAADAKGVTLTTAAPDELALVGDEHRLLQVLSNLVENALRHTPGGGGIELSARASSRLDAGRGWIEITVRDTGEGIPAERLPRIFDRFERGESAAEGGAGFGLGLAIVRELVELHGGTVEVESAAGSGTTFTLTLPAVPFESSRPN